MNGNNGSKFSVKSTDLFLFMWKKRTPLILITVAGALLSGIASFFITPLYKSTVVLYPPSSIAISKYLLSDYSGNTGLLQFGGEEQSEQLLQVLNSVKIRSTIVKKYNLYSHYEIDSLSKYARTKLNKEFEDKISFKPTKYMSVIIEVLDRDRDTAALIANHIAELIDTVMFDIQKDRARQGFEIVKEEYNNILTDIQTTYDSLSVLKRMGIYDFKAQSEFLTEAYATAIRLGNKEGERQLAIQIKLLQDYGGKYEALSERMDALNKGLPLIHQKYVEAKVEVEQRLPQKFVVDYAVPADKKSYPVRSLIILLSTISTFVLALITLFVLENYYKQEEE